MLSLTLLFVVFSPVLHSDHLAYGREMVDMLLVHFLFMCYFLSFVSGIGCGL